MEASKSVQQMAISPMGHEMALSRSELSILHLLREGDEYKDISYKLGKSLPTIKVTMVHIRRKTGFNTTIELLVHLRHRITVEEIINGSQLIDSLRNVALPKRLIAIAQAVMEGKTNKEIATAMAINEGTVKINIVRAMEKTGTSSRIKLGIWYNQYLDYMALIRKPEDK